MKIDNQAYLKTLSVGDSEYCYYCVKDCAEKYQIAYDDLPITLKVLFENILRNADKYKHAEEHLQAFKKRQSVSQKVEYAIPYKPARILMQDFTGVPSIVDLAAMRDAVSDLGGDAKKVNPHCQIDLVIDHSVQVMSYGSKESYQKNVELEYVQNKERYEFLKWGQNAFKNHRLVPPGHGICHQVNLEYLAKVVWVHEQDDKPALLYPDTLVGTDSHTTMINALGVLGWGVGGIEAEAAMLGQSIELLLPDVVGVYLKGSLNDAVSATDLVLTITEQLRRSNVVGKFVEFYGPGVTLLSLAERATIANMAPEYGATCGFFAVDDETLRYLRLTGRSHKEVDLVAVYARTQGMMHQDKMAKENFTSHIVIDLSAVQVCLAGPKRPQDRVNLTELGLATEKNILQQGIEIDIGSRYEVANTDYKIGHGDVLLAAITSCTNTSNPSVLILAGMLAKAAVAKGLKVKPWVKTSFAPGSKVVVAYLEKLDLIKPLEQLGFYLVGFGCTTCIGNSGPLDEDITETLLREGLVVSSVLSGNRNFEGRIHPYIQMNWLASPPLVIAYALAGTTKINLSLDPVGTDCQGMAVYLRDIWPDKKELDIAIMKIDREMFIDNYKDIFLGDDLWKAMPDKVSDTYPWQDTSMYIRKPSFFEGFSLDKEKKHDIKGARVLLLLDDSVTTDHISPAGMIKQDSPAGRYLQQQGVAAEDFNSYGARRGNHEVMVRGTFANVRIKNQINPQIEGGYTTHADTKDVLPIYDACMRYRETSTPLIVMAGKEYGTGSSRDWAAKGSMLLGVKAVIAESFERIHRSNLIGMGVLPCQWVHHTWRGLGLDGSEHFDLIGIEKMQGPHEQLSLKITYADGAQKQVPILVRIDTAKEFEYYKEGGILPSVLKSLLRSS